MKTSSTSDSRIVGQNGRPWFVGGLAVLIAVAALLILEHETPSPSWGAPDAEVVFLGTSHTIMAIDPVRFDYPIGRLTFPALDLQLGTRVLLGNRGRWPELRAVVVEVDEFSLMVDTVNDARRNLGILCGELDIWSTSLPNRRPIWASLYWRMVNLVNGDGTPGLYWRRRFSLARVIERRRGLDEGAPSWEAWARKRTEMQGSPLSEKKGMRRVRYLERLTHGSPEPNLAALERLARRLVADGVALILISYPNHETYLSQRPVAWDEIIREAVGRARKAGGDPSLPFLDLRSFFPIDATKFRDIDHLNEAGTAAISIHIAETLKVLIR